MNKTNIEWCDYTWNPVVGCKHGCSYCYARKINNRFKIIPKWDEPQFFSERMEQPIKAKPGSKIFVGSMCDLFGEWVPSDWIHEIIDVCRAVDDVTFMFLTKNPKRYNEFDFPKNCQVGVTVTTGKGTHMYAIASMNKTFLSIEPLLGSFENTIIQGYDLVIVGAMTGPGAIKPKKEWIESIKHPNIFYKENIKKYMR